MFTDTAISIPVSNRNNETPEPTLAVNGDIIFSTGDHYAQLSTDGGQSFSFIDPATAFPPAKGGFCCDQRTIYVPSRDLLVWSLQYASDVSGDIVRIAVSKGQTNQAAHVWSYFDLTPQALHGGFPAGFVLDVTDLGFSDNFLYLTGDVFTSSLASSAFVASVVMRFSLDDLVAGQFANWDLFTLTDVGALKPVQGANQTMFFLTHPATSSVRLLMLPESASALSFVDVAVMPYSDGAGLYAFCPDPNGVNPCGGADDRAAAAWRSASLGEVGVMWNAAQDGTHPFPYVQAAILRESDGALLNEAVIASPQTAWQYPSAAVNARGDVAGTMSIVGPQTFLGSVIWISDNVNGHSLSPLESQLVLAGSQSPSANRWGDFFTTRAHSTLTNLWTTMAVAETQEAGGPEPHYLLFGRSGDGTAPSGTEASFTYSPPNPVAGQTVSFQDLSLGAPSSWSWDFGDGKSSTVEDAVHVFSTASSYDVALTAAGAGGTSVIAKTIVVLPSAPRAPSIGLSVAGAPHDPTFDFYDAIVGQAITFTASETDANQWIWDFGDGTSASGKSVVKTYLFAGMMSGHLTVRGDGVQTLVGPLIGSFTISVAAPSLPLPSAAYTVSGVTRDRGTGNAIAGIGSPITFAAAESHAAQYLWFFGDGTTGSGKVVTKEFARTGDWTVKLVVFGDGVTTAAGPIVVEIPIDVRSCSRCPRVVPFR